MNLFSRVKSLGITLGKHQVVCLQMPKSCLCLVIRLFTLRTHRSVPPIDDFQKVYGVRIGYFESKRYLLKLKL